MAASLVKMTAKIAAAAALPQSPGKPAAFQPPAGMFPKSALKVYFKGLEGVTKMRDKDADVVPVAANMTWNQFRPEQDVSPDSTAARLESAAAEAATSSEQEDNGTAEGDATLYDTNNASATAAACQEAAAPHSDDVHIDLGQADASTMPNWWDMFLNSKCGGGFLARSLFSAATQDSVLGAHKWNGPKSVTGTKSVLAEMRSKWIEWNENPTVNEWVRAKLFHIIVTNPKTYAKVKVKEVL
jgi:hypothetical protein